MTLALRAMAQSGQVADKFLLFMHMAEFSFFNQPSFSVSKETLKILSTVRQVESMRFASTRRHHSCKMAGPSFAPQNCWQVFPETLGTCVIMDAPVYFATFFNLLAPFIDPKTKSKAWNEACMEPMP